MPINTDMENVLYLHNGKVYELQTWCTDGVRWSSLTRAWCPDVCLPVTWQKSCRNIKIGRIAALLEDSASEWILKCVEVKTHHGYEFDWRCRPDTSGQFHWTIRRQTRLAQQRRTMAVGDQGRPCDRLCRGQIRRRHRAAERQRRSEATAADRLQHDQEEGAVEEQNGQLLGSSLNVKI